MLDIAPHATVRGYFLMLFYHILRKNKTSRARLPAHGCAFVLVLVDGDGAGGGKLLLLVLGQVDCQHAGFVLALHVLALYVANVEGPLAAAAVTLLTYDALGLLSVSSLSSPLAALMVR